MAKNSKPTGAGAAAGAVTAAALPSSPSPKKPPDAKPPGFVAPFAYLSCSVTHELCDFTELESKQRPQSTQAYPERPQE